MDTSSKGTFAFLQDLPENNTKPETEHTYYCQSDFKNAFDEINQMNIEQDNLYKNNVNFYKEKCQIL